MFTPKQLQDFIDAPRALAAFLEGRGHIRPDVPVAAPVAPSQRVHTSQPRTGTIIKQIEAATGRPATRHPSSRWLDHGRSWHARRCDGRA
jgi:hypothetical protein